MRKNIIHAPDFPYDRYIIYFGVVYYCDFPKNYQNIIKITHLLYKLHTIINLSRDYLNFYAKKLKILKKKRKVIIK